ncbi:MAG: PD40 domain-containing protein [Deltaproteobacteria bacterium]|nr:PD40 domain-containing protein [Deltaproteobacteria bacterium]
MRRLIPLVLLTSACPGADPETPPATGNGAGSGTIVFAGSSFAESHVYDLELPAGPITDRFKGDDPYRLAGGRTLFVAGALYSMSADGTMQTTIAEPEAGSDGMDWNNQFFHPQASDDESKIAYVGFGGIHVVSAAGEHLKSFTGFYSSATWLPDGRLLVSGSSSLPGLFISDAELTALTRLDSGLANPAEADVSADGTKITFQLQDHIHIMAIDGSGREQITVGDSEEHWPVFSPDGKWIAFLSQSDLVIFELATGRLVNLDSLTKNAGFSIIDVGPVHWLP